MRILITGSRDMNDYSKVAFAISAAIDELHRNNPDDKEIIIVHGAARGADTLAGDYVSQARSFLSNEGVSIREEKHPAKWREHGKAAGPKRNAKMVALGADVCLAFPSSTSVGTLQCARMAEACGIPVETYRV